MRVRRSEEHLAEAWRQIAQASAALPINEVRDRMTQAQPAWRLALDGRLVTVNRLAIWLWDTEDPSGSNAAEGLIGLNIFELLKRNAARLPIAENEDFWATKFVMARAMYGDDDPTPLEDLRTANREFDNVRRNATAEHRSGAGQHYRIKLAPPGRHLSITFLEFQHDICPVIGYHGEPAGYFTSYRPVGLTSDVMDQKYDEFRRSSYPFILPNSESTGRPALLSSYEHDAPERPASKVPPVSWSNGPGAAKSAGDLKPVEPNRQPNGSVVAGAAVVSMFVFFIVDARSGGSSGSLAYLFTFIGIMAAFGAAIAAFWFAQHRTRDVMHRQDD